MHVRQIPSAVLTLLGLVGVWATLASMQPGMLKLILVAGSAVLALIGAATLVWSLFDLQNAMPVLVATKRLGIRRIHSHGRDGSTMSSNLRASKDISILASRGARFFWTYKADLLDAVVTQRASIRVALATPGSEFVRDIEEAERRTSDNRADPEIRQVLGVLTEIANSAREQERDTARAGTIRVGHFTTQLRSTMILCDKWGWVNVALPPKTAIDSMTLELVDTPVGYLGDCHKHFDRIWEIIEAKNSARRL